MFYYELVKFKMSTKNYAELIHLFPIYLSKSKMPKVKMMRKKVEAGQWGGGGSSRVK